MEETRQKHQDDDDDDDINDNNDHGDDADKGRAHAIPALDPTALNYAADHADDRRQAHVATFQPTQPPLLIRGLNVFVCSSTDPTEIPRPYDITSRSIHFGVSFFCWKHVVVLSCRCSDPQKRVNFYNSLLLFSPDSLRPGTVLPSVF